MRQWLLFWSTIVSVHSLADEELSRAAVDDQEAQVSSGGAEIQLVGYPAAYFERYQPTTALHMIQQLPGFQIDDGNNTRGFGSVTGNILINDRRPSAKQDLSSAILGRIPASHVERIELIHGQVRGIDLRGQGVVANIILRDEVPAAIRWEAYVRQTSDVTGLTFGGSGSLSDRWGDFDFNVGFDSEYAPYGKIGVENVVNGQGELTEGRFDDETEAVFFSNQGNFNASTWLGDVLLQLNTKLSVSDRDAPQTSRRVPQTPGGSPHEEFFKLDRQIREFEIGADAERALRQGLLGKVILLFFHQGEDELTSHVRMDPAGNPVLSRSADTGTVITEGIGRLEFDWMGWRNHAVQANLEGAVNALDGSLAQTVDTGAGPMAVEVPGANTRIKEIRGDFLLKDTWSLDRFELAYGLSAEISTLSQTGDADLERSFFFIKPQAVLTYFLSQAAQARFQLAREVSQLNFNDFVSAAVFEDNDLALGNPNLRPETTWVADLSYERRFSRASTLTLRGFHHWISDVEDLLPLTEDFEVPGNIGDGRRWGLEFEGTLPLDWSGLTDARLDVKARRQYSRVTDPVTGAARVLSASGGIGGVIPYRDEDNDYAVSISFRQDFEPARAAWGWDLRSRAERPLFKVNELDVYDEGTEINAFIETTRWLSLNSRLGVNNLLNFKQIRERTVFTGERDLSPVAFRVLRNYTRGRRFLISFRGSF